MEQAAVQTAIEALQAQGKAPSLGNLRKQLGTGSWRDLVRLRRAILGNGATQAPAHGTDSHGTTAMEEGHSMSMDIQGLPVLGQPIPPRAPRPSPPGADALATRLAAVQGEAREAAAAEAVLMAERMALKAQQRALEQDRKALLAERLSPRTLDRREAELLDRRQELEEEDFALTQRQHAARLRAGSAAESLKQAQRRLERAQRAQALEG